MQTEPTRPRPSGLIRGHLATFPARAALLPQTVEAILPQVDRLTIVFNEMPEPPAAYIDDPRIEAVTTDANTKDVGKFLIEPAADDIVFLLEDDIGYPADYVQRSIDAAGAIGWDGSVFGYLGFVHHDGGGDEPRGWQMLPLDGRVNRPRGVRMLGTGTAFARGDALPPMGFMLNYIGQGDVGFALHALRTGRRAWALPRPSGWLRDLIPPGARDPDLFAHERGSPTLAVVGGLRELIAAPMGHVDMTPERFAKAEATGRAKGA